ncbi:DUF4153 domain-containing protein [Pelotomaculum propionicicum]|uniref:DUF4153 domain-containing protein n=1 Tax=Pelotomaculum propionicicum TaxID=258475 RepID=UPI003B76B789
MNAFIRSISQIFKGAASAFQTFPAAIACALAFAIVTMIRIQLDWPMQEPYNFLFDCLHWSFAMGAVFSLAAITAAQSRFNNARAFLAANLLGAAAAAVTFLALYLTSGTSPDAAVSRYMVVSGIATSRVLVAILASFLAFIVLAGYPEDQSDFARSLFMTQKALFIALVYGGVITAGASSVAGAVQALLYPEMSEKVYMYIATMTGFLGFTIFAGYFPDFRRGRVDEHREEAQKQPRFIEILFEYILVPIVLALTAVLLLWAGRTVVTGTWPVFVQLYGIATGYAAGGIWLHVMVTHLESGPAKFYRRVYPVTTLVILAFEAWALFIQLGRTGLKTTEYSFALIWVIAVVSAVLLLVRKARAHTAIAALVCAAAVFSVLPAVGYHALPVTAQVSRLEKLLASQGMLAGEQLTPAKTVPEQDVRESITDAVTFLAYAGDAKLPDWFDRRLGESNVFKSKLGFEQTWPITEDIYNGGRMGIALMLPPGAVDISDFNWAVNLQNYYGKGNDSVTVDGVKGTYRISWTVNPPNGVATLKIELDGRVVLEQYMNSYIDRISAKYPPGEGKPTEASFEDMSLRLETQEVSVLLIFNNVDINVDPRRDNIYYGLNPGALYLKEKP